MYPSLRVQRFAAPHCAWNPALENPTLKDGYVITLLDE